MSDSNFASLSSTLLARKGGAKPAMRPQLGVPGKVDGAAAAANLEDLGWNDMGDEDDAPVHSAPVIQLSPAERADHDHQPSISSNKDSVGPDSPNPDWPSPVAPGPVSASPVRDTIERIAAKLDAPAEQPAASVFAKERSAIRPSGKRAAFTLRLDADRHLKLRLACTVRNCSAQQLVTDAVDALLREMPEIEQLAAHVRRD